MGLSATARTEPWPTPTWRWGRDMVKRPCLDGCGKLTDRPDHRCPTCASAWHQRRDARRGSSTARGYDARHEATRARLLPHAYGTNCPRCGELMLQGQALDLGHSTDLRIDPHARADRIEHAQCNRGSRVLQTFEQLNQLT